MELEFSKWLPLREMGDATLADTSHIELQPSKYGGGLSYSFNIGGINYRVSFHKQMPWTQGFSYYDDTTPRGTIADKGYSIEFEGANSFSMPGTTQNPTAIYAELIKAVKKLIEQENPEYLTFYGAQEEQDLIYDKFYKLYLRRMYTRVGKKYLRNDLFEKYKREGGPIWDDIESLMTSGEESLKGKIQRAQQQRAMGRATRLQAKQLPAEPVPGYTGISSGGSQFNPSEPW